ncbi:MAG: acetyl-CoA carboxylase carboxyltransferase subunit [Bradyrhizobiaceae bacterium]|nr:MAG: acetyl-CoA carboxylase carboxyltransferase subunit [Bradyrhizobiaceae bacterium]
MPAIATRIDTSSDTFRRNRAHMLALIGRLRALEARAATESARAKPLFDRRGQLLPRERIARLLDAGSPWLELSSIAGFGLDHPDPEKSIPGGGMISGIGHVAGVRALVVASDSGIDAGAIQSMGREKLLRAQELAIANRLPFVHLVESAGANLLKYRVEGFVLGGAIFYNLARLSAAGIPVVTVVHGSSTAGGAYMPGLSDYVIMVRGRAKAFLAGPPLLKAATGEIATDEELGGAVMHTHVSGLGEYLAEDDADGVRLARELLARLDWGAAPAPQGRPPRYPADELLGLMPEDPKKPIDMREVIARLVDESDFLDFKPDYGPATVCGHAALQGIRVGIVTNNGPLDPAGATKATHFIQACCQAGLPLLYLQNTTGYLVGKASEEAGMIKHGSKMIQAVANAGVPQITLMCGASYGAGNYGMCGRAYNPRFLFSWPNAQTAVMGAEQAALTMAIVMEAGAKRKGEEPDAKAIASMRQKIVENFERQSSAFVTSALMLDDGIIDPRDTRNVLGYALSICREADRRAVRPIQFGVARP